MKLVLRETSSQSLFLRSVQRVVSEMILVLLIWFHTIFHILQLSKTNFKDWIFLRFLQIKNLYLAKIKIWKCSISVLCVSNWSLNNGRFRQQKMASRQYYIAEWLNVHGDIQSTSVINILLEVYTLHLLIYFLLLWLKRNKVIKSLNDSHETSLRQKSFLKINLFMKRTLI